MFELFLRKTALKNLSKEHQYLAMLLCKGRYKILFLEVVLFACLATLPYVLLVIVGKYALNLDDKISFIIFVSIVFTVYFILAIFINMFFSKICTLIELIDKKMYTFFYALKGKAISKKDFDSIKEDDALLYCKIIDQEVNGYCYDTCLRILKSLKKGTVQFIAVKVPDSIEEDNHAKQYTMHALYVNNGWCFDTYSQRQHPLEEVMKRMGAKTYMSISYEDLEGKSAEEFKAEYAPALWKWCEEHDCYTDFGRN